MNFENLKKILSAVDKDTSINRDNVINKIKEVLQREDTVAYQEWENKNFDVNHIFTQSDPSAKFTLLIVAAANSYKNMVNALLERDADVHVEDENQETALHCAVYSNSAETINALLERGANINTENKDAWTPLHIAACYGYKGVVNVLLNRGAKVNKRENYSSALHYAAANGHIEVVNALLAKGANVHEKNNFGKTPLRYAAANGHIEIVNALLAKGANVHEKDNLQKTPLHCAAINGHAKIVNTLLVKGANVYEKDGWQKTPLYYAIRNGHEDVIKDMRRFLKERAIENGANAYCLALISGIATAATLFATGTVEITGISPVIAASVVEIAALTIGYARYKILKLNNAIKVMKELQDVDIQSVQYMPSADMLLPI